MACSTEKLLLLITHRSYSDPLEKILCRQPLHHPPQKLPRFGPPLPSEVPLPSVMCAVTKVAQAFELVTARAINWRRCLHKTTNNGE